MMRNKVSKQTQGLERKGEMDRGGFNSIASSNWRPILGVFLITSLCFLLYQNSASYSVWTLRRYNETFLAAGKTMNETTPPKIASSTGTQFHTLDGSTNVSSPSEIPKPSNQTPMKSTNTSSPPISMPEIHTLSSPAKISTTESRLNGLLPVGFDVQSCLSRYESHLYRKPSPHKASQRLLSKLRNYERLHRRCGPKSMQYNSTLTKLIGGKQISNTKDCNYIVWLPVNGLGNRMLSLASTFLYAMLTNRVLLVAFEAEMLGVFCDPFLNSTWMLPQGFPHRHPSAGLPTYANLVKDVIESKNSSELASSMDVPSFLYVYLQHESHEYERFFHCGEGQTLLDRVPFLILQSDQYFAPSLFMIPSLGDELNAMFPEKDTIFHLLGRYLFSPSNQVWRQITQFYKANLSKADKKVGIQVRVFNPKLTPAKTAMEQMLACALNNNILPKVDERKNATKNETSKTKAVLVASLYKDYSENLKAIYKTGPTTTGEEVLVYQPSHEEVQRFHNNTHHVKALTEMYLLSLCDELVTSGQSTFGYVAQSLGAKKALIMYKTVGEKFRDPPCKKALSIEPCYHFAPRYDCKRRTQVQHLSSVFPHVRRCEDLLIGMKMVSEA